MVSSMEVEFGREADLGGKRMNSVLESVAFDVYGRDPAVGLMERFGRGE